MPMYTKKLPPLINTPLLIMMKFMNFIVIASGIIMALTFFFVVIFRYGFQTNLFAYEEWLMTIAFWMFFMASAIATHDQVHINADILGFLISNPKLIWYRALLVEVIELTILVVLSYWGYLMCHEELSTFPNWQSTIALKIPFLLPRFGIFLGFFMMTIYSAMHLYQIYLRGPLQETQPLKPKEDLA